MKQKQPQNKRIRTLDSFFTPLPKKVVEPASSVGGETPFQMPPQFSSTVKILDQASDNRLDEDSDAVHTSPASAKLNVEQVTENIAGNKRRHADCENNDPNDSAAISATPLHIKSDDTPTTTFENTGKVSRKRIKSVGGAKSTPKGPKVSIKKGKVYFAEQKISFDLCPETIQELASFHEYLRSCTIVPDEFPAAHLPLLVKLIQDSDQTLAAMLKKIDQFLFSGLSSSPDSVVTSGNMLPLVETAIEKIASRINYGLSETQNASIWRWEAKDLDMIAEKDRSMIIQRRELRTQATTQLQRVYDDLEEEEKDVLDNYAATKKKAPLITDSESKRLKLIEKGKKEAEAKLAKELKDAEAKAAKELKEKEKELAKKKKEEDRLALIEAKEKQKQKEEEKFMKSQPKISGFFTAKPKESPVVKQEIVILSEFEEDFKQFHCKPHTKLAPLPNKISFLDDDYIKHFRSFRGRLIMANKNGRVPLETIDRLKSSRVKLLQFCENHRPAFFGTWNRKNCQVKPRRPLEKERNFDYEVDSDEEWEDEGEGDECHTDEEEDDDEEVDATDLEGYGEDATEEGDGWLVPHGYLSDDEGMDEMDGSPKKPDTAVAAKLLPKKIEPLIPVVYGPLYEDAPFPENLAKYSWVLYSTDGFCDPITPDAADLATDLAETTTKPSLSKKPFTDEMLPELVMLVHKSAKGLDKIIEEFRLKFGDKISRQNLQSKIKEIAVKDKRDGDKRLLWHVKSELLPVKTEVETAPKAPVQ